MILCNFDVGCIYRTDLWILFHNSFIITIVGYSMMALGIHCFWLIVILLNRIVCVCLCACVRACVRGCVGAWVRVCVSECVHACMRACVRVCAVADSGGGPGGPGPPLGKPKNVKVPN